MFTVFACYLAALAFSAAALGIAWMVADLLNSQPELPSELPPNTECWIRANDWEFIPARLDDVIDGEDILLPAQYASMRQMEYRDRMQRENADAQRDYQDFHSALCEPDEDEDDWMIDIGGEG